MSKKIVIIGAGPAGLGAAYRLQELGYKNWEIYEKNPYVGGLAASFKDDKGFTWDMGGHVIFSHYDYVNKLVDNLLGKDVITHKRSAWISMMGRMIPYPFQNNIRYLPDEKQLECLSGLIETQGLYHQEFSTFEEWCRATFGDSIAESFLIPYNSKVWAYPLQKMSYTWIGERVSEIYWKHELAKIILNQDDTDWGPNSTFKYPLHGGIGQLYNRFVPYIKKHLHLKSSVVQTNLSIKTISLRGVNEDIDYDILINTSPIDKFVNNLDVVKTFVLEAAKKLKHTSVHAVGIGLKNLPKWKIHKSWPSDTIHWIYYPENNCCFHRIMIFSNYSANLTPSEDYSSLICETSYSEYKPNYSSTKIEEETIEGLVNVGILNKEDLKLVETVKVFDIDYAYPVPTLDRDKALGVIQPYLQERDIYSIGRFGAWKYEEGNMDHSIMAGVNTVNKILGVE